MFHLSKQHIFPAQQVISITQSYPCPRCKKGVLEPYGFTETFECLACSRTFVSLKGGRMLYPAQDLGWKIAPIFWWDGLRWHWARTTTTSDQILRMAIYSLFPVILVNLAININWLTTKPNWCNFTFLTPVICFITIALIYLCSWDFNFAYKNRKHRRARSNK